MIVNVYQCSRQLVANIDLLHCIGHTDSLMIYGLYKHIFCYIRNVHIFSHISVFK